jgi:hypothetical protein
MSKKNRVTSLDFGIWLCIVGGTESVRGFPTGLSVFFLYAIKCMLIFGVKLPIRYPFHEIWVSLSFRRWIDLMDDNNRLIHSFHLNSKRYSFKLCPKIQFLQIFFHQRFFLATDLEHCRITITYGYVKYFWT